MESVAIATLVIAALIIAAAALGLMRVIGHLRSVAATLDALIGGIDVIVEKTDPVPGAVGAVNASLAPVREFAEGI